MGALSVWAVQIGLSASFEMGVIMSYGFPRLIATRYFRMSISESWSWDL